MKCWNRLAPNVSGLLLGGVVLFGLMPAVARAADSKPAKRVRVYCFAQKDPSGFVDQRTAELGDSLKDLKEAIVKKKDWLELAESKDDADIVLEVVERTMVEREGDLKTETTYDKNGKVARSRTTTTKEHDVVVKAVMTVGDYQNEFTGKCDLGYLFGGAWRQAAKNLVGSMEDWVKKNYTRLMQAKARGSSSSE